MCVCVCVCVFMCIVASCPYRAWDMFVGIHILYMDGGWERLQEVNEYHKWRWSDKVEKITQRLEKFILWISFPWLLPFPSDILIHNSFYIGIAYFEAVNDHSWSWFDYQVCSLSSIDYNATQNTAEYDVFRSLIISEFSCFFLTSKSNNESIQWLLYNRMYCKQPKACVAD